MRDHDSGSRKNWRRDVCVFVLALFVMVLSGIPVLAAGAVQDDGNLFSANARTNAENKIAQIQRDTGKTVAVKTVTNLGGKDISAAADQYAQQQKLNGVLIFAARDEKKLQLKVGVDTRPAVPTAEEVAIRDQLTKSFAANDFDGGLLTAIDRFGSDLRAATPARTGSSQPATPATAKSGSSFPVGLIVLLVVALIAVVLIVMLRRSRTPSGPSGSGSGYGPSYPQQGGYGPGYGPGYGQPSGGGGNVAGSIIGGAAAGIGGAIIGNAIYDHFRDENQGNRDSVSAGDYGSGYNGPQLGDDQGRMDDSPADSGSWDSGANDPGAGDWGGDSGSSDFGGGDPSSD